jgi:DNA-binding transcriptional LysR family regulator
MDRSQASLERMRVFVRVAERASLSAVARELRIGQSTVTRQLRELEAALGVRLLSRTTRRVSLTEEGARYYGRAVKILDLVELAADEARSSRDAAAGRVRVSCTAALGVRQIARLVFAFQDRHPAIAVDLGLTDERVDLVRGGIDLAVRLGPRTDSTLRLRSLGASRRLLVAAPAYLAAHGRPQDPQDLTRHEGVRMSNIAGSDQLTLHGPNGRTETVAFGGRLRVDHGLAAREALLAGRGLGPAHLWLVDDLLSDGRLEVVLPDWRPEPTPLSLLIVPERAAIARVRLLADHLAKEVPRLPGLGAEGG